jgi:hypothetical protein
MSVSLTTVQVKDNMLDGLVGVFEGAQLQGVIVSIVSRAEESVGT